MSAKESQPDLARKALYRTDYRPSEYRIDKVDLDISLDDTRTEVKSRLHVIRNPKGKNIGGPLALDGEELTLKSLKILEGGQWRALDEKEFTLTDKVLTLNNPPAQPFELEIVTETNPEANTKLEGIYKSGGIIGSQCEARGFRRITYFLDRPDNLAVFNVRLEADKEKYPVLLSNGNGDYTATTDLGNGRHAVEWRDPFPKPSYLFATIAGDLKVLDDSFTTMSGKKVDLRIFVQPGYEDKISWAMQSIKRSMKWDEEKYGREYDLDCFHVVALDKFNAGAMENKGLNVFKASYLVGDPETSTDAELTAIEAVIAHEYFHNWTGNRVTVRDWFELTLKEGLTVLRDRQFTGDMHSQAIKDIRDAASMRTGQFRQDAGPASIPIRPDSVEDFDNIYNGTPYDKGSHVLGMMKTIIGDDAWRLGMDRYFEKFDGQAVTCDDFIDNMQEVSGVDLTQFRRWYSQSGTPEISYEGIYDAKSKTYLLTLTQFTPATADQPESEKKPLHIPVRVGLIGQSGKDTVEEQVLHLTQPWQTFVFKNVEGPVVPSVLRGFSAPVKVVTQPDDDELLFRMAHDKDPINKLDAVERLMIKQMHKLIKAMNDGAEELSLDPPFLDAYKQNLYNALDGDMAFADLTLGLPAYELVVRDLGIINPEIVSKARLFMTRELADIFAEDYKDIHAATVAPQGEAYSLSPAQVGRRALHNTALQFLGYLQAPESVARANVQYGSAGNMTERLGALSALLLSDTPEAEAALADLYARSRGNGPMISRWFAIQARIPHGDVLARIKGLMKHADFDITTPDHPAVLLSAFCNIHPTLFHAKDGSGYKFVADNIIALNAINARTAARISSVFGTIKRYDPARQTLMVGEMERIMQTPDLDPGVKEVVGKTLDTMKEKPAQKPGAAPKP